MPDYEGGLLVLAEDLGVRMLRAFTPLSPIPFAWINLKRGVCLSLTR